MVDTNKLATDLMTYVDKKASVCTVSSKHLLREFSNTQDGLNKRSLAILRSDTEGQRTAYLDVLGFIKNYLGEGIGEAQKVSGGKGI